MLRPWTVVPLWERMKVWELLSSYLGEKLLLFLALAAPFLCLGVVKHRCLVGGTQTQPPPQLDRGEADAPHRSFKVTHCLARGCRFCKTPEHRYFRRCDPGRLRCDDSTVLCTAEAATDIEGQMHMAVFPIKLHLWTLKFPFHIIFTHHKIFFFFSPNH